MPTSAKIIADSISESGVRLTTMVLEYPRIIHSEFMTHRMFSRNASSSRAIPVEKQIERVENDAFFPSSFGKNKAGMQASEDLDGFHEKQAISAWNSGMRAAIMWAKQLVALKVHKQLANRLLEPFSHIQVVVTATEWDNFFLQRLDKNAQPEIQELARVMKEAMDNSTPKLLKAGEWHLPFIEKEDYRKAYNYVSNNGRIMFFVEPTSKIEEVCRKLSVARSARVSYGLNERGWGDIEKDLALYDMLLTNNHWSPFEHQASPMDRLMIKSDSGYHNTYPYTWEDGVTHCNRIGELWSGNLKGWIQNRRLIQQSN